MVSKRICDNLMSLNELRKGQLALAVACSYTGKQNKDSMRIRHSACSLTAVGHNLAMWIDGT